MLFNETQTTPGTSNVPETQQEDIQKNDSEMEIQLLSDSLEDLEISAFLETTIEGTSQLMANLSQPTQTQTQQDDLEDEDEELMATILEKGKRLKASFIIMAKANHHKNFMETCLQNDKPPQSMTLWCKPHVYHTNSEVERQWRDTLHSASLKLVSILIKHHSKTVQTERKIMEEIQEEMKQTIKNIKKPTIQLKAKQTWNQIVTAAKEETKTIQDDLKKTRENKLNPRKRRRPETEGDHDDRHEKAPKLEAQSDILQSLGNLFAQLQKNGQAPRQPDHTYREERRNYPYKGRGKDRANGREYPRKRS